MSVWKKLRSLAEAQCEDHEILPIGSLTYGDCRKLMAGATEAVVLVDGLKGVIAGVLETLAGSDVSKETLATIRSLVGTVTAVGEKTPDQQTPNNR